MHNVHGLSNMMFFEHSDTIFLYYFLMHPIDILLRENLIISLIIVFLNCSKNLIEIISKQKLVFVSRILIITYIINIY